MFDVDYDYTDTPRFEEEQRLMKLKIEEELEERMKNE